MVTTISEARPVGGLHHAPRAWSSTLAQVEGTHVAAVSSVAVDAGPITLKNRDQIDLGGIRLEFVDPLTAPGAAMTTHGLGWRARKRRAGFRRCWCCWRSAHHPGCGVSPRYRVDEALYDYACG